MVEEEAGVLAEFVTAVELELEDEDACLVDAWQIQRVLRVTSGRSMLMDVVVGCRIVESQANQEEDCHSLGRLTLPGFAF